MPVKNGANYITEAIEGIRRQEMNVEIIVVNDGSTDNTADIAAAMGCRVISNPENVGNPISRNRGLNAAAGEFILFHDHDDVMREGALQQMYAAFERDSELQVVQAKVQDFISPELDEKTRQSIIVKKEPYYGLMTGAMLIRKSVFDITGGFDESLKVVEGVELQMRFRNHNIKMTSIDMVSTDRRIHNSNKGRNFGSEQLQTQVLLLRRRLARRK